MRFARNGLNLALLESRTGVCMSLVTDCPNCSKEFTLPDELFGKRIKCKACGSVFRVGGASAPPTTEDFDALDAVDQTQVDASAIDGPGGPGRALPGVGNDDDFATQPPPTGGGDDFATQWGGQPHGDDFATQYGGVPQQDEFATSDMHVDDFQTQVPPTGGSVDFSETVVPAAPLGADDTIGDTWGDTHDGGHFAENAGSALRAPSPFLHQRS